MQGDLVYTTYFWWDVAITGVFILVGLACLLWAIYVRLHRPGERYGAWPNGLITGAWVAGSMILWALVAIGWFPYDMDYHARREVSGEVQTIDSRLLQKGDGMEEKFVIVFAEDPSQEYGCLDTRCASLQPGDSVALLCTLDYDMNSADGWDCGWSHRL